jgi:hypothetical protein
MLAAQTGPAAYVRSAAAHATQAHDADASKSTRKLMFSASFGFFG